ncbi:MAG: AMP nucleosidase, partial [Rhodobacter sp.]|nr:AMP nucleosidase [Rhodobacter sp.]
MPIESPEISGPVRFRNAAKAVDRLTQIYEQGTAFLRARFQEHVGGQMPAARYRAYYPEIRITTSSFAQIDSRLSFGHVAHPGTFATTITRPDLFRNYLIQQIELLIEN